VVRFSFCPIFTTAAFARLPLLERAETEFLILVISLWDIAKSPASENANFGALVRVAVKITLDRDG